MGDRALCTFQQRLLLISVSSILQVLEFCLVLLQLLLGWRILYGSSVAIDRHSEIYVIVITT